jgi:hypothetical protein
MATGNYILLVSSDGYEFYLEKIVAEQSGKLKTLLNGINK